MNQKYKKIILLLTIMFLMPKNVNAYSVTFGEIQTESNQEEKKDVWQEGGEGDRKSISVPGYNSEYYKCEYYINANSYSSAIVNGKDLNGDPLLEGDVPKIDKETTAGTSIALEILEKKSIQDINVQIAAYKLDNIINCTEYKWNCCWTNQNRCMSIMASTTVFSKIKQLLPSFQPLCCWDTNSYRNPAGLGQRCARKECTKSNSNRVITEFKPGDSFYESCKSLATKNIKSQVEDMLKINSYEAKLYDANEYNDKYDKLEGTEFCPDTNHCNKQTKENNTETLTQKYQVSEGKFINVYKVNYKPVNITFKYKPNGVCINVKTAKVRYLLGNETSCKQNEMLVNQDNEDYWRYFIPLEMKSNQDFLVSVQTKSQGGNEHTKKECEYVIDNNPTTYYSLIKPKNYEEVGLLDRPIENETTQQKLERIKLAKQKVSNGCYLELVVVIPITQQFYNEVLSNNGNVSFKGFNFYYRPIDIKEPFPNGVSEDSLWKDKKIELSNSYGELTYYTDGINLTKVRQYNSNNPYTSWLNMNIDGTSSFIDSEGIIKRNQNNTNLNNIYKLGCGPLNSNQYIDERQKIKNPYYIEGCDNK